MYICIKVYTYMYIKHLESVSVIFKNNLSNGFPLLTHRTITAAAAATATNTHTQRTTRCCATAVGCWLHHSFVYLPTYLSIYTFSYKEIFMLKISASGIWMRIVYGGVRTNIYTYTFSLCVFVWVLSVGRSSVEI